MALLVLLVGSLAVSLGIGALGVFIQDGLGKVAEQPMAGKVLRWIFFYPVLEAVEKFWRGLKGGLQRLLAVVLAVAAFVILLSLGASLAHLYLISHHWRALLAIVVVLIVGLYFATRGRP